MNDIDRLRPPSTSVLQRRKASRHLGILGTCISFSALIARIFQPGGAVGAVGSWGGVGVVLRFTNWRRELVNWPVASDGGFWLFGGEHGGPPRQPDRDGG